MNGNKDFETEYKKLIEIYQKLPPNKFRVAEGLVVEAARLRVYLAELWEDVQKNGTTESFSQSPNTPPYQRERPQARLYVSVNKNYQSIIKQLTGLLPAEARQENDLDALMEELMKETEG